MRDAEMLLLVDDQQSQVFEVDTLAEQCMCAHDNIHATVGDVFLSLIEVFGRNQPRGLRHVHRKTFEAIRECLGMLARKQGRWDNDRHLLAVQRDRKGCAECDFGFAEADIAANQPVHRLAGIEIVQRRGDRTQLIFGFLIGETRAEFVVGALV